MEESKAMSGDRLRYGVSHWAREGETAVALAQYQRLADLPFNRTALQLCSRLLGDVKGARVLDYGGGAGIMAVTCAQRGADVVLVDAEPAALRTAEAFAEQRNVARRLTTIASETVPSALRGERFDVILLKDVVEHVHEDTGLLQQLSQLHAPGGVLLLSTQNSWSLNYVLEGTYQRKWRGNTAWCGWDKTHVRFYTPRSLSRLLHDGGYRPERWASVALVPYNLLSWLTLLKVDGTLPAFRYVDLTVGRVWPFNRLGWNLIIRSTRSA